jgi:hypothetical protein
MTSHLLASSWQDFLGQTDSARQSATPQQERTHPQPRLKFFDSLLKDKTAQAIHGQKKTQKRCNSYFLPAAIHESYTTQATSPFIKIRDPTFPIAIHSHHLLLFRLWEAPR